MPCPQVAFGNAGFALFGKVSRRLFIGDRQSVFHQIACEIDASHEADADIVVIAVLAFDGARYIPGGNEMANVVTRIPAAGPDFVSGIKTRLRKFGGIDTEQLNAFFVMPKRVAVMSKPMLYCGHGATGEHEGESEDQPAHG
ncbi:hypothetical protein HNQ71_003493 [Mesorhizobium sangaii]|uniref:Uncharacterized protein n=1 Tax=Mesorhizobium sangaii TaxID=505389 RepID=A0A841PL61_9HYPH|nr:hypothetical protein [Mesorhizobium sangaii]MBB6410819.1 hypothetical protein [Mesorhizobium sangaii]